MASTLAIRLMGKEPINRGVADADQNGEIGSRYRTSGIQAPSESGLVLRHRSVSIAGTTKASVAATRKAISNVVRWRTRIKVPWINTERLIAFMQYPWLLCWRLTERTDERKPVCGHRLFAGYLKAPIARRAFSVAAMGGCSASPEPAALCARTLIDEMVEALCGGYAAHVLSLKWITVSFPAGVVLLAPHSRKTDGLAAGNNAWKLDGPWSAHGFSFA